jgi:hypothetical protein
MAALVAPPYPQVEHLDVAPRASPDGEEGATARIDFRLGEHLKSRIDDAAGRSGRLVNDGSNAVLAITWCAGIALLAYLWARALFIRKRTR